MESLQKIIEGMEKLQENHRIRTEKINNAFDDITEKAAQGNKKAQTVVNFGSEAQIKEMIGEALFK